MIGNAMFEKKKKPKVFLICFNIMTRKLFFRKTKANDGQL